MVNRMLNTEFRRIDRIKKGSNSRTESNKIIQARTWIVYISAGAHVKVANP